MTKRALRQLLLGGLTSSALIMLPARASLQERQSDRQNQNQHQDGRHHDHDDDDDDDDDDDRPTQPIARVPSGQFVTPTAIKGSVQQFLNPGLAAYPDFVAGEAVRAQLSPDGTTLAVITAGQNSLYKPDGTVDAAASTQFIFL